MNSGSPRLSGHGSEESGPGGAGEQREEARRAEFPPDGRDQIRCFLPGRQGGTEGASQRRGKRTPPTAIAPRAPR
eukprot:13427336-Alexandrium_andersonii.AAC.1